MHLTLISYLFLTCIAIIAGFIDTLAGGGGLMTVPALLITGMPPLTAFGTNKMQAAIAEISATWYFMKNKSINYRILWIALLYMIIGATIGTIAVRLTPVAHLEKMIPFFLLFVLLFFIYQKYHAHRKERAEQKDISYHPIKFPVIGLGIGFYNGFFGPGTGSLLTVSLIQAFKINLQKAIIYTKPLNFCGNLTALVILIAGGHIDIFAALLMSIGAFTGGRMGAHFVMYKNMKWLNIIFISLMTVSTLVTFIKYYG